jgi:PAS domain S-box-containing protein
MIKPIKLLVINEDERDFIDTKVQFAKIPHSHHYILYWCNSYEKAINAMLKSQFDVYLIYDTIGLYTGLDLLNEAVKSNVGEPIIMVSDNDYTKDQEALQKGASAYLVKDTLDIFSLERSIRYVMHQQKNMQRIKESEYKFRVIFEKSPDPILITDNAGAIHDVNIAAEKFFGLPRVKMLKSNASQFYKNQSHRMDFISEIEQKGAVTHFTVELIAANDEIISCSVSSFMQISQHGNNELFHTIIHDMSHIATSPAKNHPASAL